MGPRAICHVSPGAPCSHGLDQALFRKRIEAFGVHTARLRLDLTPIRRAAADLAAA